MTALDWETARRNEAVKVAAQQRTNQKPVIAWWWIIAKGGLCGACNAGTPQGAVIAYNHDQRLALCETCVQARRLSPSPSKALIAARAPKNVKAARRTALRLQTSSAIAVACPACGATPGQRCRHNGAHRKGSHPSRKKAAQATHLRP